MSINPIDLPDIDALPWQDYQVIQMEARQIRRDMNTADALIKDALARYKKKKLAARSKRQAEELATLFAELDEYRSPDEIMDAYGYDVITERERDRLLGLWDTREQARRNNGIYTDRVMEMLEIARRCIGDKYRDKLDLADTMEHIAAQYQEQLQRERWEGQPGDIAGHLL